MKFKIFETFKVYSCAAFICASSGLHSSQLCAQIPKVSSDTARPGNLKIDLDQAPGHVAFILIEAAKIAERNSDYNPFKLFVAKQRALTDANYNDQKNFPYDNPDPVLARVSGSATGVALFFTISSFLTEWDKAGQLANIRLGQLKSAASLSAGSIGSAYLTYIFYDLWLKSSKEAKEIRQQAAESLKNDFTTKMRLSESEFLKSNEAWYFIEKNVVEFSVIALGIPEQKLKFSKLLKEQTLEHLKNKKIPNFWELTSQNIANLRVDNVNGLDKFENLVETIKFLKTHAEIPVDKIQEFEKSSILARRADLTLEEQRLVKARAEIEILERNIKANRNLSLGLAEMQKSVKAEDIGTVLLLYNRSLKLIQWQERSLKLLQLSVQN